MSSTSLAAMSCVRRAMKWSVAAVKVPRRAEVEQLSMAAWECGPGVSGSPMVRVGA